VCFATVSRILQTTCPASNPARVNATPLRSDARRPLPAGLPAYLSKVSGRPSPAGGGAFPLET
jgi:hypothetical protein